MKKEFRMTLLLPHRFKWFSRVAFYLMVLLGLVYLVILQDNESFEQFFTFQVPALINSELFGDLVFGFQWVEAMFFDEALSVLLIVFGLMSGFSKEKYEDEYIDKMRNDSLRWSLFINYSILLLTLLGVYGLIYLSFMFAQLFLIILLFNLFFDLKLYLHYKSVSNEE